MNNMNTETARAVGKMRKSREPGPGRPRKPTRCPKCDAICKGYRLAQVHCILRGEKVPKSSPSKTGK